MNDRQIRKHSMLVRADSFNDQLINDFSANSVARQLFGNLKSAIADAEAHAAAEVSGRTTARHGTGTRADAREALREDLEAISRTARMMADDVPGVLNKFPMPPRDNDSALINAGRASLGDAFAFKAQFIAHELPADFLEDLTADIEALDQAIINQSSGVGDHVAAGAALDDDLDRGVEIVRKEDVIIRNKYANSPEIWRNGPARAISSAPRGAPPRQPDRHRRPHHQRRDRLPRRHQPQPLSGCRQQPGGSALSAISRITARLRRFTVQAAYAYPPLARVDDL